MTQEGGVEYEVGDLMVFPFMGAYTSASATTFNGFAFPKKLYLDCENTDLPQHGMFKEVQPMGHVDFPIETKSKINLSLQ
jgi:Na+/serine symporter